MYGPLGIVEASLGNGLREETSYDSRARVSTFAVAPATGPASGGSGPVEWLDSTANAAGQQSIPQGSLLYAKGWAADNEDGSPIPQVVLLVDAAPFVQATLGLSRPDVASYYNRPNWANSGWNIVASTSSLSPGTHTASVRGYDSSGNTTLSASATNLQFTITSGIPPTINMEPVSSAASGNTSVPQGGLIHVSGWAVDPQDGAPVARVQILLDGTPIGDATLGGVRQDVENYFKNPAWVNSGWTFTGSIHSASPGTHQVTAAAYDSIGNMSYAEYGALAITVTSSSDTSLGNIDASTSGELTVTLGGTVNLRGWAVEPAMNPGAPVSRVDIEVDDQTIGQATLGISRPDVVAAYGRSDYANSGWTFSGALTGIPPGGHIIRARMYTHTGASFLIRNYQDFVVQGAMAPLSNAGQPARYAYSLTYQRNGNVATASDTVNGDWTYSYDGLNRLITDESNAAGLSWRYDSFGNRLRQTALLGSAPESALSFTAATNRADQFCYDAAGNELDDVPCNQVTVHEFAYDAEGELKTSGYGSATYVYDAEGYRVAKQSFGTTTNVYFYDVAGNLTVETDGNGALLREELYAGSRHIATRQNGQIIYAHTNWLGTESARSDSTGNLCETNRPSFRRRLSSFRYL